MPIELHHLSPFNQKYAHKLQTPILYLKQSISEIIYSFCLWQQQMSLHINWNLLPGKVINWLQTIVSNIWPIRPIKRRESSIAGGRTRNCPKI